MWTRILQQAHVALEFEFAYQLPQVRSERSIGWMLGLDLLELRLDAADVADTAELIQIGNVLG